MDDHVYRVIEITGWSATSIEDAIQTAVARASRTLRNLRWFEVTQTRGHLEGGKIQHYQVTLKIGFTIADSTLGASAAMAIACFAVRAEVPEAERSRFDHWYETDHLPWALRAFGARRAWRCWSRSDPGVHVAFYEFDSVEQAQAAAAAGKNPPPGARFDRGGG